MWFSDIGTVVESKFMISISNNTKVSVNTRFKIPKQILNADELKYFNGF